MTDWGILLEPSFWQAVQFERPYWFALAGLVALLWAWHAWRPMANDWEQAGQAKSMKFKHSLIQKMVGSSPNVNVRMSWRWLMQGLRGLIFVLLVTALAKPVQVVKLPPEPQTKTVRDIVFVVETSVTMGLTDYQVNGEPTSRVAVIRQVLDQFVSRLEGNRFGLILFAEQAYTLMPLTSDTTAARMVLKRLKPYLAGRTDEAAGEALGLALMQAEKSTDTTENRVVVLISDGSTEASALPLEEAIHYAQGMNIPIYTIGVGASSEAADQRAFRGLIYETLEAQSLQQLANETGGRYHQVGSGEDLTEVLQAIDRTEGTLQETPRSRTKTVDFYAYFVAWALMVLVAYFALLQLLASRLRQADAR